MNKRNAKRVQIITLMENMSKTHKDIANIVCVSRYSISRIIQKYEETGDASISYSNCGGHNKKFDDRYLRHIRNPVLSSP